MKTNDESPEATIDHIAQRYRMREGFRLVDYDDVALPVYRLTLDVLLHVKKPISPVDEFVLKALDAGLESATDIAAFLGLESSIIDDALRSLVESDDVYLAAPPGERSQRLMLTEKGRNTRAMLQTVVPEERTIQIDFDGITRRPIPLAWLSKSRDLRDEGIREVPSFRPRPELDDVRLKDAQAAIRATVQGRESNYEILAIRSIEKRELLFQRAVILIYRGELGFDDAFQVGFVIDGRLSSEHETAFAGVDGVHRLGIPNQIWANDEKLDELEGEIPQAPAIGQHEVEVLQNQAATAEVELHEAVEKVRKAETTAEEAAAKAEINKLQARVAELEAAMEKIDIRPVEVYEHPKLLKKALNDCKKRLMVISPWIKASVVNREFVGPLERALKRNVEVYIGYGLGEDDDAWPADQRAEKELQQLAAKFKNFKFQRLGDTHAKVLICDDRFAVVTSFNWLSFRGDAKRTFRDERGTYVGIPIKVEEQWQSVVQRFTQNAE